MNTNNMLGGGGATVNGATVAGSSVTQNDDNFRVTYNDGGFNPGKTMQTDVGGDRNTNQTNGVGERSGEAGGKTAAQLAEDAKNRTIGHYVVGKYLNQSFRSDIHSSSSIILSVLVVNLTKQPIRNNKEVI